MDILLGFQGLLSLRRLRGYSCWWRAAVFVVFVPALVLAAQQNPQPSAASAAPAAKAPDVAKEAVVFDKLITNIREEADGTGTRETTARIRVLADAGVKQLAVLTFTYTAANQQIDIAYVRVIKPDGTVVVTPDYNQQDMPADVTREAPLYSDIHQKHVAVKGLSVGDTLEYQVTHRTIKPEARGQFWLEYTFQKDLVTLDEELDLDVPADKLVTVSSADVQPTVMTAKGRKLYHWVSQNLARPDPDAAPKSMKNWKPSVQVTTFASWAEVGDWYRSLEKDQVIVTPAIQAKADALTRGLTSEDDKTRAIFNAVALHTHYVGLDFGIGRYQPHAADDVLSNEYGDCKDKHTLLAALLKAEGIEAWPVLISTGRELDAGTPSPAQFNHVITAVPRDGKLVWMDSTEEVAPVGVLEDGLRDKQALAIPSSSTARLERTPADLPFAQEGRFSATGKIDASGKFTGRISQEYHGDVELLMRSIFRSVPESQWKELVQRLSSATGFGGEVGAPEVSPVEKLSEPLRFAYDYTREKYSEWTDQRISPPMPPVGWELMPGVKQIRPADDVEIGSPGEQVHTATVELPKGWDLDPPDGTDLVESWAEYHSKYRFVNGAFTAERRLVFKQEKVPLADWDKYVRFREAIYADTERMAAVRAQLTATDRPPGSAGNNTSNVAFRGSVRLDGASQISQMLTAIKPVLDAIHVLSGDPAPSGTDLAAATQECRAAVRDLEIHSHDNEPTDMQSLRYPQVLDAGWTCLGWAELENHDLVSAESYLRSAWKLGQHSIAGYELARVLEAKGDKAAAAHMYELAYVSSPGGLMDPSANDLSDKIAAGYKKLTGKEIHATALRQGGEYNGSLRAELDAEIEIHGYVRATKLNGQGYYAVSYLGDGSVHASMISGDAGMSTLAPMLQAHGFRATVPTGSKARLVREVHVICSQWGGCDAYMLLPSAVEIPIKVKAIPVAPRTGAPAKTRTVRVTNLPVN